MTIDDKISRIYNKLTAPRKLTYYGGTTAAVTEREYTVLSITGGGELRRFSINATYQQTSGGALYTPSVTIVRDGYNLVSGMLASAGTNTVISGYESLGAVYYLSDSMADLSKRPADLTLARYNSAASSGSNFNQSYLLGDTRFTPNHTASSADTVFFPVNIPSLALPFANSLLIILKYGTVTTARNAAWGCWIDLEV